MKDDTVSRVAVMESLTREYNRRRTGDGLKLAWIEKAVNDVPEVKTEIIRCKECKYRYIDEKFGPSCELDSGDPYDSGRNADEDDWFCADAERGEAQHGSD